MFYFKDTLSDNVTLKEAFEAEIENLIEMMSEGVVVVTFKKLDGKIREIRATTNTDILERYLGKLPGWTDTDNRILRVFDVEDQEWKTFYKDNLINYGTIEG